MEWPCVDMRRVIGFLLLAAATVWFVSPANAGSSPTAFSYSGTFASDDDKREFFFILAQPGTVTIRTWSYAGGTNNAGTVIVPGGFDPSLSIFGSDGLTVAVNQDGGCGSVGLDPTTKSCWDAYLAPSLPAGSYRVVLTQSVNTPAGGHLADGFLFDGSGNFTQAPGGRAAGFWDFYPDQRTGSFALDITSAASSSAPAITSSATVPFGITNAAYTPVTLTAQAAAGSAFTWSVATGSLPLGMVLTSGGLLQGTPQTSGTYVFTVQATDGIQPLLQTVTLAVFDPLSITSTALPAGAASQPYTPFQLIAAGGAGTYSWSAMNLPPGLSLSSAGVLSGAPSTQGSYAAISITVTDLVTNLSVTGMFSISVSPPALLISGNGALPEIALGGSVSAAFGASGGTAPYTFSVSGSLPAGLALDSGSGLLSGVPTQPGNYAFTVQVRDAHLNSLSITVALQVLGFSSAALPDGKTNTTYSASLTAAGGSGAYTFSATGTPPGLSLAANGSVTGTPKTAGTFSFPASVADGSVVAMANFSITVTGAGPLSVPSSTLGGGALQLYYSDNLGALGGTAPYSWSIIAGTVPPGLSISYAGAVTGTPTAPGTFSFTAHVADATGAASSGVFTIVIAPAPLKISTGNSLPNGIVGIEYPLQILTPSGGLLPYTWSISSGTIPDGLGFTNGQISGVPTAAGNFTFSVTATDAAGKSISVVLGILISPAQADLILGQTFLSYAVTTGSVGLPTPASVTIRSSDVAQILSYSYALSPAAPWLSLTGGSGTPGSIGVSLTNNALGRAASGTPYQASIVVTCVAPSPCAGKSQTIAVSLSVTAPPAQLSIGNALLSFNTSTANTAQIGSGFSIRNAGGGTLAITSITAADSWISIGTFPASLAAGPFTPLTVTINPAGLPAAYYRSTITVNSDSGVVTLPVSLLVTGTTNLTLSPQGTQFQMAAGGVLGNAAGSFSVGVNGSVGMNGTAATGWDASVLAGAGWLRAGSTNGSSTGSSPGTVAFSIDPAASAALVPGTYYGTIRVTSSSAVNSPQDFQAVLTVTPAATPVKPNPSPAGLLFTSTGIVAPAAQNVRLFASSASPLAYQASASTSDGARWLAVNPATGTTSAGTPDQSNVSVNPTGLKPGIYQGGVSYAFSSAAVRTVNVTLIVPVTNAAAGQASPAPEIASEAAPGCVPSQLVATQIGLVNNFAQLATLPAPLAVLLVDNCGNPVTAAQVAVAFSNGDAPLPLSSIDTVSGIYSGTWTPLGISPQVTVVARAAATNFAAITTQITGEVTANAGPVLTQNAVLHVYNPLIGAAVAPGTILQLYGSNLAAQPVISQTVPLGTTLGQTTLGQTSVTIGGIPAPLYYASPTQINAQAPFELVPGNQYQVVVNFNGALTAPGTLSIAPAVPGIAAYPTGLILAQHLDGTLISETSPAAPGSYVILYLAGLGATDVPVPTGGGSPATPLAHPSVQPTLTLNGTKQPYQFAGLTPGIVGLYQINFLVPAGTPNGDMQLVISQSGVASNTVILPVQQ